MKTKFLLYLLSLLGSISSYGQDYLITNRGDTLHGEVRPQYNDKLDRVQISDSKTKSNFTALQVMTYSYKGDLYRPLQRENTIRFMKVLKNGYLSLYAFRPDNLGSYDGRLLAKRDGTSLDVPNLNFKKLMISYLGDCSAVKDKLNKGEYGRKDVMNIVVDYNGCLDKISQSVKVAESITADGNQKAMPLEKFRKTIEGLDNFSSKKDAMDLLSDMIAKVKGGLPVPNYQVEVLKGLFQGNDSVKDELDGVLSALKGN